MSTVVTATVMSAGELMAPTIEVLSIDVTKEVDRIPEARLVVRDGNSARGEFPISDTAFFEPGKEIEILLRYERSPDALVFKGVVVRHGLEVSDQESVLVVEMKDAAVKLTQPRRSRVFRDKTDAQVFEEILSDAGLTAGPIAGSDVTHAELIQYEATDWDFLLGRADVLGLAVAIDDGTVKVAEAGEGSDVTHSLQYGIDEVYEFTTEIDATRQPSAVESVGWDLAQRARTEPAAATAFTPVQGNLTGEALAEAIGFAPQTLVHQAPLTSPELQAWADARLARSRMALLRGRIGVPGVAGVKPLDLIKLSGMGARFSGTTLVTGVRHRVTTKGWRLDVQFGLSPDWFCTAPGFRSEPAGGLLPAIAGLQLGVVEAFEEDPEGAYRVKVLLPCLGAATQEGAVWARLASPEAGDGRGFYFRPEVGDEVVVGFVNSDPRHPIILGSMFGPASPLPESLALDDANEQRAIVTRSGTRIEFIDADKPSVIVATPGDNKIVLSDDAESIELSDQHGNTITMDSSGIQIMSAGDVKIEASGNVVIKGTKVDVK